MHPILRGVLAMTIVFSTTIVLSFLAFPDPTGMAPLIAVIVLTPSMTPFFYRILGEHVG